MNFQQLLLLLRTLLPSAPRRKCNGRALRVPNTNAPRYMDWVYGGVMRRSWVTYYWNRFIYDIASGRLQLLTLCFHLRADKPMVAVGLITFDRRQAKSRTHHLLKATAEDMIELKELMRTMAGYAHSPAKCSYVRMPSLRQSTDEPHFYNSRPTLIEAARAAAYYFDRAFWLSYHILLALLMPSRWH